MPVAVAARSAVVSATPMLPEFTSYAFHLALGVRQHGLVVGRLLDFIWRPRLRQKILKLFEIVGADRTALAAQHDESHGSVESRYLRWCERARNLFGKTKARNAAALAISLFHVIVDLYIPIPERNRIG